MTVLIWTNQSFFHKRKPYFSSFTVEARGEICDWSKSTLDNAWSTGPSTGAPGWTCCSIENPCKEKEGDCDSNDECEGELRCGQNNCNAIHNDSTNFALLADCCINATTCDWSGTSDADTWSCCTDSEPCEEFEGDCDNDDQCKDDFICGENNCISFNPIFDPAADCCIQPNKSKDHDQRNNFDQKIRLVPATSPSRGSG